MVLAEQEASKIAAGKYSWSDYPDWGRKGGRPKKTTDQKLLDMDARKHKKKSEQRARQGGSWRQGECKNVVWTTSGKAHIGEKLRGEMEAMGYSDATQKQQEDFWKRKVTEYAEGRDIGNRETRKRI